MSAGDIVNGIHSDAKCAGPACPPSIGKRGRLRDEKGLVCCGVHKGDGGTHLDDGFLGKVKLPDDAGGG